MHPTTPASSVSRRASSTSCACSSKGNSDREIAEALFIGTRTVQTHVANLFAKLGVNARAEAAAVAVRRGLV